jgi:hypothetical protein
LWGLFGFCRGPGLDEGRSLASGKAGRYPPGCRGQDPGPAPPTGSVLFQVAVVCRHRCPRLSRIGLHHQSFGQLWGTWAAAVSEPWSKTPAPCPRPSEPGDLRPLSGVQTFWNAISSPLGLGDLCHTETVTYLRWPALSITAAGRTSSFACRFLFDSSGVGKPALHLTPETLHHVSPQPSPRAASRNTRAWSHGRLAARGSTGAVRPN